MTRRSELEPGLAKEAEEQATLRTDPVGSLAGGDGHHLHIGLASVGELLTVLSRWGRKMDPQVWATLTQGPVISVTSAVRRLKADGSGPS